MARDTRPSVSRPVVGVTGNNSRFSPSWYCTKLAVWLAGGRARRISIDHRIPIEELDGLVISGGDDIHPTLFDDEPSAERFYDVARDELEQSYINRGRAARLPILGICRGHQLINVTLGGNLHLDIRRKRSQTSNRRGLLATKTVKLVAGSRLHELLGTTVIKVNSLHIQAVDRLGDQLDCEGRDLDGFCQSIAAREEDIIGVQWHPEYLFYLPAQLKLFRWIIERCCQ